VLTLKLLLLAIAVLCGIVWFRSWFTVDFDEDFSVFCCDIAVGFGGMMTFSITGSIGSNNFLSFMGAVAILVFACLTIGMFILAFLKPGIAKLFRKFFRTEVR
jgi:hypothetical protein